MIGTLILAAAMTAQEPGIVAVQVGTTQDTDPHGGFYVRPPGLAQNTDPTKPNYVTLEQSCQRIDPAGENYVPLGATPQNTDPSGAYYVPKTGMPQGANRDMPWYIPCMYAAILNPDGTWSNPWVGRPVYAYYRADGTAKAIQVMGVAMSHAVRVRPK